jgi:(1->4)-alpha-D-glucan 1-alpha-D-glucosylmutase
MRASYRVQLHAGFTFADAKQRIPYLQRLGISHVYLSPIAEACPGSMHGYDVTDPTRIRAELGGEEGFRSFARTCLEHGLRIILDIVPNHMGIGSHNPYWMEILEFGPDAPSAAIFDIDWNRGYVHLPMLGASPEEALAKGDLTLALDEQGRIVLRYYEHAFPLAPESAAGILRDAAERASYPPGAELAQRWAALAQTPSAETIHDARLAIVDGLNRHRPWRSSVGDVLQIHQAPGRLADILASQHWRLAHWRTAAADINYRRFFNIHTLAGVRVEDAAVFDLVHRLPLHLIKQGQVQGLRVDHVDGLMEPELYCRDLRAAVGPEITIHVEKILAMDEDLRPWPVDGTTGYEMLNLISGIFVDRHGYEKLRAHAMRDLGVQGNARQRVAEAKAEMLQSGFAAELDALCDRAALACAPLDRETIRPALVQYIAAFPVYRTYSGRELPKGPEVSLVESVLDTISVSETGPPSEALSALRRLLLERTDDAAGEFRFRLQQLTGPVMAKGYEDTELYRYPVLLSANEVGGSTDRPYFEAGAFHARAESRMRWPRTLIPLATHDTKRGADARARLNAMSERADEWIAATARWSQMNAVFRSSVDGDPAPTPADEAFIYQTLLGSWPTDAERIQKAMLKSIREAKLKTSWEDPGSAYEDAVARFVSALLSSDAGADFRSDFAQTIADVVKAGYRNSTGQLVLQMTLPGVPDLYQGTEMWDFSLVDPDNRGPVDWNARAAALESPTVAALDKSGAGKLAITARLLRLRADAGDLLISGEYLPLNLESGLNCVVSGVAFIRRKGPEAILVVVETRQFREGDQGRRFALPPDLAGSWHDVLSGQTVTLGGDVELRTLPPLPLVLRRVA